MRPVTKNFTTHVAKHAHVGGDQAKRQRPGLGHNRDQHVQATIERVRELWHRGGQVVAQEVTTALDCIERHEADPEEQ